MRVRSSKVLKVSLLASGAALGLSAAPAMAQADGGSDEAETPLASAIIVTGRAQQLYRVDETSSGKLATPPLESSLVVTSITQELIEDQGARDAQDLYRNISGVSFFSYAGVTARGFRQEEIFYDGLRGDPYAGFSVPQLFNVERVEFLKGPSGMLYGPGAPGGLFNYITKKPDADEFTGEIKAILGTEDRLGGSAEINAPLGGGFAARGGVFYEDRGLFRFNAASRTLIVDGGVSFEEGPARIILQATRYDQELDANRLRGVPVDDNGDFLTSRRWNHNEPGDFLNLESDVVQGRIEADVTPNLSIDVTARYNDAVEVQNYHEPRGLFDSDGDGQVDASVREFRDQLRAQETFSLGANAVWSADLGGNLGNRVLVGADFFDAESNFTGRALRGTTSNVAGLPNPLSLFDPQYGRTDPTSYTLPAFRTSLSDSERFGFYLLDELTIGRLILTGGVRFDSFTDNANGTVFEDEEVTYRAGAVYRVTDEISLFAQYADSFEPQDVDDQDPLAAGPFAPTSGDIVEGGIKTALMGGRIQSSLSAYQIRRQNLLQTDPRGDVGGDGVDDLVAFGEVTSKGVEVDIAADITPNWVATLAYGYNDTRITENNGGGGFSNSVGDRFANAPEHQLGFWTRYQFPDLGLAVALGGDYVSDRVSLSDQPVNDYFVFDASLIYETGPIRAMVRVDNLFDTTYAASGFIERTGHFPGEPRSLFVEVGYRF
ncbi:TonB-dependent siderophore receptor [Erythrobacter sp.]|uniref:TonB-dependent siderophore receptor n=1 Tax=Erythrobacter sp. TaxID=1042 RepID=UPI001B190A99|nr:TonB-dependent siderophore receptor [Erythrobacter sp.]MBO6526934.1 TonB-dependent siderophore receptor [Erythrobacter sp.]MBO6528606.1 TonB-dependent siderophore receptor [Erythrobacter sp.]